MPIFYFKFWATGCFQINLKAVFPVVCLLLMFLASQTATAQVLNDPVDVSQDFQKAENVYFIGNQVTKFDSSSGAGEIQWNRYLRNTTLSFNKIDVGLVPGKSTEFPATEYDEKSESTFFHFICQPAHCAVAV